MEAFKISHLWRISCFNKGVKSCFDQLCCSTAKDCLLSKQVFISLLLKSALKASCSCPVHSFCHGKCNVSCSAAWILMDSNKARYAKALQILPSFLWARRFWSNHNNINIFRRGYPLITDIKSVGKTKSFSCPHKLLYTCIIDICLEFIRHKNMDDFCFFCSFIYLINLKAFLLCPNPARVCLSAKVFCLSYYHANS